MEIMVVLGSLKSKLFIYFSLFCHSKSKGQIHQSCSHPPNPRPQSAKLRLAAEEGWLSLGSDLGVSTHVLRLGGIYGPGRRLFTASACYFPRKKAFKDWSSKRSVCCCSAIDTLLKQQHLSESQLRRASRRFTSRVHVEDICQALQASIEKPSSRYTFMYRWWYMPLHLQFVRSNMTWGWWYPTVMAERSTTLSMMIQHQGKRCSNMPWSWLKNVGKGKSKQNHFCMSLGSRVHWEAKNELVTNIWRINLESNCFILPTSRDCKALGRRWTTRFKARITTRKWHQSLRTSDARELLDFGFCIS